MIPRSTPGWQSSWKQALATAFRDPAELLTYLELDPALLPAALAAAQSFSLCVPRGFAARMQRRNPDDPLLRQVLPLGEELQAVSGFGPDPVGDLVATTLPGVLHKYAGRALVIGTGACAVHCRYCFRRHYPYAANPWSGAQATAWRAWLGSHPDLTEIILSGGDPLLLPDAKLAELTALLAEFPHITTLRIHSRVPIVLPERLDAGLLAWLAQVPQRVVLVTHANHAQELAPEVASALAGWREHGVTLLNQSVLLRGVNDHAETLAQLSQQLFSCGILPYYLHQLDPVAGAAHFAVPDDTACTLVRQLRTQLPGYLVPRLVREIQGAPTKQPVEDLLNLMQANGDR